MPQKTNDPDTKHGVNKIEEKGTYRTPESKLSSEILMKSDP